MASPDSAVPHNLPSLFPPREEVERKRWRYIGYRGFSEWMASDNDFLIVRRFDKLAVRVLLLLQWELTKLETKLAELDFERSHEVVTDFNNGSFDCNDDVRQGCIREIQVKLKEYDEFINGYTSIRSRPDATSHSRTNVQNWLQTHDKAVDPDESALFTNQDDFVEIVTTPRTPLRSVLERIPAFRASNIFQRTPQASPSPATSWEGTIYQLDRRIDHFVNALICVAGFIMLVVPLWILFYVSSRRSQLAVITVFIALFLGIVQSVCVAMPFESLAATAAYSAVLMVFMQIGPQTIADGQ